MSARRRSMRRPQRPHDAELPHAAAVVTHGGHGTVICALRHGLPVLVMPHDRDQNDNAARAVEAGAGLWLDAASDVNAIRDALDVLIDDAAFAQSARRLGAAIEQEIAQSTVVEALETLAGARFTSRASRRQTCWPAPARWAC
jgi:UDP:flavonoid glycosyltransferase YjiC (YdhE family)